MIRPATLDDLDAIMRLERESFPTDAWSDAMMREELASPHGRYLVLETAGRLAGYAGLRAVAGSADGDVQTIAVAAEARGRGSGRRLLRALLEIAAERGVREVFLDVRADNPVAQALYASEGFVVLGTRPRYYQPDDVDAVVMRLDVAVWRAGAASITQAESAQPTVSGPEPTVLPELCAAGAEQTGQGEAQGHAPQGLEVQGQEASGQATRGTGWC